MDITEVKVRLRQELQKRTDAFLCGIGIDPSHGEICEGKVVSRRFFFRNEELPRLLDLLRETMPQQVETILHNAMKISQKRFDLLGYKDLDYGPQIDWHLDRVHGKQAPEIFGSISVT